jgi:RNA polymerase sigma factor (sigma-70 family)
VNTRPGWPPVSPEGPYADIESLVRATYKDCCRAAFRILGKEADAEDAIQNAYAKLTLKWPRVSSFETAERQCAYLFRIVTNEALQIIRARDRRPEYVGTDMAENLRIAEHVEEEVLAREDFRLVWRAIGHLPAACRRVMVFYTAGYEYGEIAEMLGIHVSTVRSHMSNAREYLQGVLPDIGQGDQR